MVNVKRLFALGLLSLLLTAAFAEMAVRRNPTLADDISPTATGEDWFYYKRNALSIVDGGLTMPAVPGNYVRPGGFLYNYFVAAVFTVRRSPAAVYVVQGALLGVSVGLMGAAALPYLSPGMGWVFTVGLALLAGVDVFHVYTFRLLSENLVVVLLAAWWWTLTASLRRHDARLSLSAGILFGLCGLTRPNLLPAGPLLAAVLWWWGRSARWFTAGFLACVALLLIRNYAVTGQLNLSVLTTTDDWQHPAFVADVVPFYVRRVLFCLGFLFVADPLYHIRPHWLLIWTGVAVFIVRAPRPLQLWEVLALTFVAAYLLPLIAVGHIANYGYRMIFPVMPMLWLLACRAVDVVKYDDR